MRLPAQGAELEPAANARSGSTWFSIAGRVNGGRSLGSSLLLVLIWTLVLTLLGLTLALVASDERALGWNSVALGRTLAAAEAANAFTAARILVERDYSPSSVEIDRETPSGSVVLTVSVSDDAVPLLARGCHLCEINGTLAYGRQEPLWRVAIALTGDGVRRDADETVELGRARISETLDVQPWVLPAASLQAAGLQAGGGEGRGRR